MKNQTIDYFASVKVSNDEYDSYKKLISHLPSTQDLLIEHLHCFQDEFHHISRSHMKFLAACLKMSLSEVFEVATFYHHFFIAETHELPDNKVIVQVCDSLPCQLKGADDLLKSLQTHYKDDIRIVHTPCVGKCECAPISVVGQNQIEFATTENVTAAVSKGEIHAKESSYDSLNDYLKQGGYKLLKNLVNSSDPKEDRENIVEILKDSKLKGLGGAGFPTGIKWDSLMNQSKPKVVAVNIDEGEVGTYKDRYYLETNPHQFFEGVLIAAWTIESEDIYLYLRNEYSWGRKILEKEIRNLNANPPITNMPKFHLYRGAGAYICGEITAMFESIEGKRGLPRLKPNKPYENGLFQLPTLGHNFETLYWVPEILNRGSKWFSEQGINGCYGLRTFSISGSVKKPGVYLAPAGVTLQQLLDDYVEGVNDDGKGELKAFFVGGSSGGLLPASAKNIPLDFGTLDDYGCFIGSMAIIVLSTKDKVKSSVINTVSFLKNESCGQCTPCRVGTHKAIQILEKGKVDVNLLGELCDVMQQASICGLGQAAPNPIRGLMKHFPEEL